MPVATPTTRTSGRVFGAGLGVVVLWASAFPAIRVASPQLGVIGLSFVRLVVAAVALLLIAPVARVRVPRRADLVLISACALVGMTVYQLLLNWGELSVPAGTASIVVASAPLVSVAIAVAAFGERLTPAKAAGSVVAVVGVALVCLSRSGLSLSAAVLIVVGAAVVQGVYHPLTRPLLTRYSGLEVATYAMVAGTAMTLPLVPFGWHDILDADVTAWVAAIYLGLFPSALGFVLWGYAVARLSVATSTSLLYLVPAVAVAIAYVWLAEVPLPGELLGGVVVLLGVTSISQGDRWLAALSPIRGVFVTRRVPLNIFGMGFGLAGLATAWHVAANLGLCPGWVGDGLVVVAALVWLTSSSLYLRYALGSAGAFVADLRDPTAGPFASLAVITPVLLAADVARHAPIAATVVVDVFVVLTVALGGWFTGTWMRGGLELDRLHPGYFLPTVAGGLVASAAAAGVGQIRLAQVMLGLGLVCWVILGSMVLARLIFRPPLPAALMPTMAIEVAPAAVASLAYFSLSGGRVDAFAAAIAGYGLLMVVAQLPLLPTYLRLTFSLGTWAFTFSWAAVASTALYWIAAGQPAGDRVYSLLVLAAITVLVGGIAGRTVLAGARGQLLPPPVTSPAGPPAVSPISGAR